MNCRQLPDLPIFGKLPRDMSNQITAFHIFGSSGSDLIFCTGNNGRVYRFNAEASVDVPPATCQEIIALRDKRIAQIVTSERGTVLVLTTCGELYTFGSNQYGQVGCGEAGASIKDPYLVSGSAALFQEKVAMVGVACYHCACITESGALYTWGGCRAGDQLRKLGHNENNLVPARVEQAMIALIAASSLDHRRRFVQVACNCETTFALDDEGDLYTCDGNRYLNFNNEKIVQISCASGHNLALSSYGSVFAWGKNYRKQLGLQIDDDPVKDPKRIASFDNPYMRIISILAFNTMSLAMSHDGIPFVWGETRLSGKVQFYFAQAERELDEKNKSTNNYYYWMLPRTCINSSPTPASAATKWSLFAALLEEMTGPVVTPHLITVAKQGDDKAGSGRNALDAILDDEATADFKILVEGGVINAHRSILLNRSGHFRAMLAPTLPTSSVQWREACENAMEIKDSSYQVYRAFIHYLYKGHLPDGLTIEETFSLLDIAELYFHDELKLLVYDYALSHWLTKEFAFELCGVALKKKADMVVSRCTSFILNNLSAVTKLASFDHLLELIDAKDILAIYQKANAAQLFKT